jgi:hypothetical protein
MTRNVHRGKNHTEPEEGALHKVSAAISEALEKRLHHEHEHDAALSGEEAHSADAQIQNVTDGGMGHAHAEPRKKPDQ